MFIKIYFDTTPLILADSPEHIPATIHASATTYTYDELAPSQLKKIIGDLYAGNSKAVVIISGDGEALKKEVFACFENIEAAGGIVQNEQKDLLFIFRKERWDLPKGKMEAGEDAASCAEREITEETGIQPLQLIGPVGTTYHAYREKKKDILKTSHWFYFTTTNNEKGTPQTEEEITEVKWIATRDLKKPMKQSYETIKEILNTFFDKP